MRFLRSNTATRITVGPFLDQADGITPEVALTVTSEKLTLVVDDAGVPTLVLDAAPTASGGANDMVHITNDDAGYYDLELAAANVNYVGRAVLSLNNVATHCPVFHEFMILPAFVYDSMYTQSPCARPLFGITYEGTMQSAAATDIVLPAAAAFANDELNAQMVHITGGSAGVGQSKVITDYVGSTDTATVDTWTTTPTGTITGVIYATAPASSALPFPANVVENDGNAAVIVGGLPSMHVADLDAGVTTAIQTGLATAADLTTALSGLTTLLAADVAYKKNVAVTAFEFFMMDVDGVGVEGATVTALVNKDGAAFTSAGTVTEIAEGFYSVNLSQTQMNGDEIGFVATATGCQTTALKFRTQS